MGHRNHFSYDQIREIKSIIEGLFGFFLMNLRRKIFLKKSTLSAQITLSQFRGNYSQ